MKKVIFIVLLLMNFTPLVYAEVFKCKLASGKIIYQSMPCPPLAVDKSFVEIQKLTPSQVEEAQNKLKAWKARQAADEAAKIKAAKELQEEIDRQETIDAINRNTAAQQQQAIAAQRQAEALERQRNQSPTIYAKPPPSR